MKTRICILFFFISLVSCTSDNLVKKEREDFYGIFRNVVKHNLSSVTKNTPSKRVKKTRLWLSKFKQPVILISSIDDKNQATLVALGNNEEKLTWVSADGISLTYDEGILIATRGYSQDLFSLQYKSPKDLFMAGAQSYNKVHRYLNGENRYNDITFRCTARKTPSKTIEILDYTIAVDKFIEECRSKRHTYKNEYDLLAGTNIVIVSKQWISPANQSFLTYNLYAFQKS